MLAAWMVGVPPARAADETTLPLADEILIELGGTHTSVFGLTEIPEENWFARGHQVRLSLDARIVWGGLGGYTGGMSVEVNGYPLMGQQLLNKSLIANLRDGTAFEWTKPQSADYVLYYSADFSEATKRFIHEKYIWGFPDDAEAPFLFVWDITPLVNPGTNTITVKASMTPPNGIALDRVAVTIGPPIPSQNQALLVQPAPTGTLDTYTPYSLRPFPPVFVSAQGTLRFGGDASNDFQLQTRCSLPNGKWLLPPEGQPNWHLLAPGASARSEWQGTNYVFQRTITRHEEFLTVLDTFTNTSSELIGIMIDNRLEMPLNGSGVRVNGLNAPLKSVIQHPEAITGIVVEDDILRQQAESYATTNAIGFSNQKLGIDAFQSHTLEWSIYQIPDGDYWDFINAVRRRRQANFPLQGPVVFPSETRFNYINGRSQTVEDAREWLQEMNNAVPWIMTHVAVNPTIPMASATRDQPSHLHGTAILEADWYLDITRNLTRTVTEADPNIKVFAYMHKNLCSEQGYTNKYSDSVALTANGQPVATEQAITGIFAPTVQNSYGHALAEVYRYFVTNLNANVYMDEMQNAYSMPGDGTTVWDRCTVQINPSTHAVIGKRSSPFLLVQPWLQEMMDFLKAHDKTCFANTAPLTRTVANWHLQHFAEDSGPGGVMSMHLSTPLHFSYARNTNGFLHLMRTLDFGGIAFTRGGDWSDYLFPITPVELRAGMIIGQERILTNRSGRFGWGDNSAVTVHVFNGQGEPVERAGVRTMQEAGTTLTELRMPSDHFAVLVRQPPTNDWPANPDKVGYFWYVTTNGTGNGTSWLQATNSLQGAIDVASIDDTVWVSNGVYAAGGRPAVDRQATNRIVIDKAITVRAASSDPSKTVIQGAASSGVLNHADAVRCVWMAANAKLIGFTLISGATMTNKHVSAFDSRGGGAYCSATSAVLSNCVLRGNAAYDTGGGVRSGTLYDCTVIQNTAFKGGGSDSSIAFGCSIISNVANNAGGGMNEGSLSKCTVQGNEVRNPPPGVSTYGGGTYYTTVTDSQIIGNSATLSGGCYGGTITRSIIRDNIGTYGSGVRVATVYNCLIYNNWSAWDGGGAYQSTLYNCALYGNTALHSGGGAFEGTLYNCISWGNNKPDTATYYNSCGPTFTLNNSTTNNPRFYNTLDWDFRLLPGSPCIDTGLNQAWMATTTDLAGTPRILPVNGTVDTGAYEFDPLNPSRMNWYVATNGIGDGSSWTLATNSLQGAIDAAPVAGTVWVANGVYATGGRNNYPASTQLTNRIVISKPLTVRSASQDPSLTIIRGNHSSNGLTNGPGAVRCAFLADGATLIGFTLTNGATLLGGNLADRQGGGAWCEPTGCLSNCIVAGNSATSNGGGVNSGSLRDCLLSGNESYFGGGTYGGTHSDCRYQGNRAINSDSQGGGAWGGRLTRCTFVANSSVFCGGATYNSTLYDCQATSNSALLSGGIYLGSATNCIVLGNTGSYGGGARNVDLYNCLIVRNSAIQGGGAWDCRVNNCTIADNVGHGAYIGTMVNSISWNNSKVDTATCQNSCGLDYSGNNSFSEDPRFIDAAGGNYRLRGSSRCVDAGVNQAWMETATDLDNQKRIAPVGGIVDMGPYEYELLSPQLIVR